MRIVIRGVLSNSPVALLFTVVIFRTRGSSFSTNQRVCLYFGSKPIRMRELQNLSTESRGHSKASLPSDFKYFCLISRNVVQKGFVFNFPVGIFYF